MFARNFWPGIAWGIIIFILSAVPGNYFPKILSFSDWLSPDKIVHIVLYFVFFYLIAKGIIKQYQIIRSKALFFGMVLIVLFGGLIEVMQHCFFIGRNGNIYDFLANLLGCLLSYVLILYVERKKLLKSN